MKIANPFERFGISSADYDGNENYGKFVIEPLERGFGLTIGNALRRVLLSSWRTRSYAGFTRQRNNKRNCERAQ